MSMIHRSLALIMAMVISVAAFAQDVGMDLATKAGISNPDVPLFSASERADIWFKLPMGATGSIFEGAGNFTVTMNSDETGTTWVPAGDVGKLRLAFVIPTEEQGLSSIRFELGRLLMRDPTGYILAHPADGALFGFDYPFLKLEVQGGMTTFILRSSNGVAMSLLDGNLASDESAWFGTSRLLLKGLLEFPDIFTHSASISFVAQQDLNPESSFIKEYSTVRDFSDPAKGGRLDTQYSTLRVSGPVIPGMFYDAWFTYGTGRTLTWLEDVNAKDGYSYQYVPISSFFAGASVDYFVPAFLSSAFNGRFLLASGDAAASSITEGNTSAVATQFLPVTGSSLGTAFSPKLVNLIVTELGWSLKPIAAERLQTGAKLFAFLRPTKGAVDASGLKADADSAFLGFEADLYGNYRIASDLGVSLSSGIFIPGSAFETTSPIRYSLSATLTLSL